MNLPFTIITGKSTQRPIPSNLNAGKLFLPYDVVPNGVLRKHEIWYSDGKTWTLILEQLVAENVEYIYTLNGNNFTNVEQVLNYLLGNTPPLSRDIERYANLR
jgi:hypothetical protein